MWISSTARAPEQPRTGGEPTSDTRGPDDPRFLTVAEVAHIMRVSKMTVYRLIHTGELPTARIGRSFRVPERALRDYLKQAFTAEKEP